MVRLITGHYETTHEEDFNMVELKSAQGIHNLYHLYINMDNGKFYVTWDDRVGYICDTLESALKHFEEAVHYWKS